MNGFASDSGSRRAELCETWRLGAAELIGVEARAVRIYQLRSDLSQRAGEEAAAPERTLMYVCRPGAVDAIG
jgi:hypothetical protein